ncbi:hypothetical protein L195_g001220 [Trifolium pratense]|uniref:Gamma-butyrobetaine hydroxylase-like N-terminal domain-containing protein n=1 Tax=Trifolium pratense TaxID=57577 RepID=A0A2K3NP30_TRIPR|nr:hypothetical protein L195_g001220 [Trifolium pratense]
MEEVARDKVRDEEATLHRVTLLLPLAAVTRTTKAMLAAIRRFNTVAEQTARLTRFSLHPPKYVEVEFTNCSVFKLSAEFLRINSPAVDGKIRSIGGEKVISGRRHVGIMSAEPVGNYGVRLNFDDLHKTADKYFVSVACPRFKVPCRVTVVKDCTLLYNDEKEKLKSILS